MSDFVDRFIELKEPERYKEFNEEVRKHAERMAPLISSIYGEKSEAQINKEYRDWRKSHLERHDTAILDELGMTIDDLLSARELLMQKKRGGKKPREYHMDKVWDPVIHAFIKSERDGDTFAEATNAALTAVDDADLSVSEKTVQNWLHELIGWGVINISASKPGRPKTRKS